MIFVPSSYIEMGYGWLLDVKWPENKVRLALMSLKNKERWLVAQDPQRFIDLGEEKAFARFWKAFYLTPLKIKRVLYRLKFW
jgi:hypothetical protein